MKTSERLLTYGLLGTCLWMAMGRPLATPVDAQPAADNHVGPASALLLQQEDEGDLTVTAADGRLAFGADAHHRTHSMAVCDIVKVVRTIIAQPPYMEQLEDFQAEKGAQLEEMADEIRRLQSAMDNAADPTARAQIAQQGQIKLEEFRRLEREIRMEEEAMRADMMTEAYGKAREAVAAVADEMDLDIVMITRSPEEPLDTGNTAKVFTDILSRTAIQYPEAIDITPEILDNLDLG